MKPPWTFRTFGAEIQGALQLNLLFLYTHRTPANHHVLTMLSKFLNPVALTLLLLATAVQANIQCGCSADSDHYNPTSACCNHPGFYIGNDQLIGTFIPHAGLGQCKFTNLKKNFQLKEMDDGFGGCCNSKAKNEVGHSCSTV